MTSDRIRRMRLPVVAAALVIFALSLSGFAQAGPSKGVASQIASIQQIKQNFTPEQKKMDSGLAFASVGQKNPAAVASFASALPKLATTPSGKVRVEITGQVSPALVQAIQKAGGNVLHQSNRFNTISAALPMSAVDAVAARSDVVRIAKTPIAHTSVGALTSQGYIAHRAKQVVTGGITGAGVNVGVLSDSAGPARIAALKASGDLPGASYALPGEDGSPGTDEGTAMMEIVYDMAPGSTPIFATAFTSPTSFADNIIALQAAGCKVIADDVSLLRRGRLPRHHYRARR